MTAPAVIKQADLARIFRAAKSADYPIGRIVLAPDGTISIITPRDSANDDDGDNTGWEDAIR